MKTGLFSTGTRAAVAAILALGGVTLATTPAAAQQGMGMRHGGMMGGMGMGRAGMMHGGGMGMMHGGGMGMMHGQMGRMGGGIQGACPMMSGASGGGMQHGQRGMMGGGGMGEMATAHGLLANHEKVRRTVRQLPDGVETVTESDDPEVAALLKRHVPEMYARMKAGRPVMPMHPVFAELSRFASQVEEKVTLTEKGVHVVSTSKDRYVVNLIREHAKLVDGFVDRGMAAMHEARGGGGRGAAAQQSGLPEGGQHGQHAH